MLPDTHTRFSKGGVGKRTWLPYHPHLLRRALFVFFFGNFHQNAEMLGVSCSFGPLHPIDVAMKAYAKAAPVMPITAEDKA